jgi:hypothetical protein
MAIASLYPTIKPSLNLDFANTKLLDSRITFTRSTTATYYDGVTTAVAEQNLLLRSQDYSATWTVTNLTPVTGKTAPDSTSTATEFTAGAANAVLTQGYTAIAGSYTFSVYLRRVTGTGDIQIAADNGTWTTKVITGTWARYDVTQTVAAGSKTAGVRVVTSGDAIEVWGAQLEQRSAVTAYTVTTTQPITNYIPVLRTAAAGVARFDHNPTTDESLGLLIEEQRTNLILQSEDFSTTWTTSSSTVSTNNTISPNGTLTADKVITNAATSNGYVIQTFSATSGTVYTISCYAKSAGATNVRLRATGSGTWASAIVDLTTGVISGTLLTGTATATAVGNGWYRIAITGTSDLTGTNSFWIYDYNTGDGYSGIYIWGAQLEAGAFATSYIPTVAATVTRNADVASMTGTNFSSWFNAGEGALYADYNTATSSGSGDGLGNGRGAANINDGTAANRIRLASSIDGYQVVSNSTIVANITVGSIAANTNYKMAAAYQVDNFQMSRDGVLGTADTSGVLPFGLNAMNIGTSNVTSGILNGTIKKIAYYAKRISNAELKALTS